jgi:hypothetical protein
MLRISILYNLIFIWQTSLLSQTDSLPVRQLWTSNTACLMPEGKWESGVFQNFRYGLNNKLEIYSNSLLIPLIPKVGIKVGLGSRNRYIFASSHDVSSPSTFLNFVSRKGIGGLISPEFDFPFIISINNLFILSKSIGSASILSAYAGFLFAIRSKKPNNQSTIDLPLVYPRMAHFYEGSTVRLGISLKGPICKRWFYEEEFQTFIITRSSNNFFPENSGTLMWAAGKSLRIKAGYVMSYGNYPFGTHWQLWPSFGMVFGSSR